MLISEPQEACLNLSFLFFFIVFLFRFLSITPPFPHYSEWMRKPAMCQESLNILRLQNKRLAYVEATFFHRTTHRRKILFSSATASDALFAAAAFVVVFAYNFCVCVCVTINTKPAHPLWRARETHTQDSLLVVGWGFDEKKEDKVSTALQSAPLPATWCSRHFYYFRQLEK